ncbi:DUF499 domain-containing protein [Microvirga arabica]|uniref:DUF499 domain-containing protein n=1 Tax=Microvirga arabica TaxID=1128671 RepID=UPI00193A56AD|nr:DUF499 domain-containing protein [Microvirga arabica]MBM1169932.1 DUF499 domain-containing protein [Microvirga arabica]
MTNVQSWTELLPLRPEVVAADGGIGDLQMSLHKAVYQTVEVPYRSVEYYSDITQPTPHLVGFFSRIARRLAGAGETIALYHLDQGMGGGKSHSLVGLYHMAANPVGFFASELGKEVLAEAQAGGAKIDITGAHVVTLTADHFSPGKATELFGPAVNLFERFLWALLKGDRAQYDTYVAMGANKATLQKALASRKQPVLILLDELMDYAMELSNAGVVDTMPGEQAFLNALMDACDDVPNVAFVVVMIRSELDPEGYTPLAESFREYITRRLNRNGTTVAVTETGDFAAIIRRRIFEQNSASLPITQLTEGFLATVENEAAWDEKVLTRLGPGKGTAALGHRIAENYPFHPDLMDLVQNEWGKAQGFQRVRSTVAIFALAALHWTRAAQAGEWTPPLIGVGDLPLGGLRGTGKVPQARCLDALLNSGLLLGNDRAIQGYRAVATTDITSADATSGRAVELDRKLADAKLATDQPNPAVRMATALFNYSLVGRGQGRRGATKAELMAALMLPTNDPTKTFSAVEEVFSTLTGEDGLGALEVNKPANSAERYWLTVKQTLRMFFNSAKSQISEKDKLALVWETAQALTVKGQFEEVHFVHEPTDKQVLRDVASGIDGQANRLVVLDPRWWTLLNGDDSKSRNEIRRMFGLGDDGLLVDNAASCVLAAVNTYQRRYAVQAAQDVLTWRLVASHTVEDDEKAEVQRKLTEAEAKLKQKVRGAYRHYIYLTRKGDQLEVVFSHFDDDKLSSLNGNDVWGGLVSANRAVGEYTDTTEKRRKRMRLSEVFLSLLLDSFDRHLTLKDVVSSFYRDPRFPLVPTLDEIRQVLYDLLQPAEHAGPGTGGWELVGSDGLRLQVESPKQLAISSIQQQLKRAELQDSDTAGLGAGGAQQSGEHTTTKSTGAGTSSSQSSDNPDAKSGATSAGAGKSDSYSWYRVEVTNRSITDEVKREAIRAHLIWLASKLDEDDLDHQLFTLKYELLAGTNSSLTADIKGRAQNIQATRTEVQEEL